MDSSNTSTVEVTITNQPFTPYTDANGTSAHLYYYIRFTGSENWWSYYPDFPLGSGYIEASNSQYTVISLSAGLCIVYTGNFDDQEIFGRGNQGQEDFQVQAMIGFDTRYVNGPEWGSLSGPYYVFTGENSSWSNTQTIDIRHLNVNVQSPTAGEYNTTDVPLNFTVSKPVSQISYCLDGQENVTIAGNATLKGLSNGAHNVTVYAADGNGYIAASETALFNVDSPTEPVQFILSGAICDAVAVVLIVAVAVGLIVYFKKRPKLSSRGFFFK